MSSSLETMRDAGEMRSVGTVGLGSSTRWDLVSTTRNQENGVANFRACSGHPHDPATTRGPGEGSASGNAEGSMVELWSYTCCLTFHRLSDHLDRAFTNLPGASDPPRKDPNILHGCMGPARRGPVLLKTKRSRKTGCLPCNLHRADTFEPGALYCSVLKDARRTVSLVLLTDSEDDDSE